MIRFESVGLRYDSGPDVLHDLSFELPAGSFHYLSGPSGAGKSSLMSLIYLARRPTSGRITLFDRDLTRTPRGDLPALRRRIGVVFQDFRLLEHLSTFDNVALPLRVLGVAEDELDAHVGELLGWVGLSDRLTARPATLSGGEKQRAAIARAVVARPRLLLADEPTGNVDNRVAARLLHLFDQLNRLGTTILIATHNDGLIATLPRPQLRLEDGRITRVNAP